MRLMRGTKGRYGCRESDMVFRHSASGGGTAWASGDGHEGYAEVGFGSRGRKGFVGWVGDSRV